MLQELYPHFGNCASFFLCFFGHSNSLCLWNLVFIIVYVQYRLFTCIKHHLFLGYGPHVGLVCCFMIVYTIVSSYPISSIVYPDVKHDKQTFSCTCSIQIVGLVLFTQIVAIDIVECKPRKPKLPTIGWWYHANISEHINHWEPSPHKIRWRRDLDETKACHYPYIYIHTYIMLLCYTLYNWYTCLYIYPYHILTSSCKARLWWPKPPKELRSWALRGLARLEASKENVLQWYNCC